ncbi:MULTISPECIES: Trp family transcriptional regulator [unclassified Moritella]|uniref:Trp family transcriptional regulator n=1 Tax=unclassified Moritella TaxID=2637987 RepID=UPI001BA62F0B|nr:MULTISPECIES: Trp family transcriptional regulator [unclassified Moritella]QUM86495.1 transcriptional regulator [Moritella sp. 28]QUM90720.1 transcriptional regulator [Moritella sp. 36]
MINELLLDISNKGDISLVLPLLFSPEELNAVNARALVYKELLLGERSQREIAKIHNISIATITRGSNNLKSMSSIEKELLQTLLIRK